MPTDHIVLAKRPDDVVSILSQLVEADAAETATEQQPPLHDGSQGSRDRAWS